MSTKLHSPFLGFPLQYSVNRRNNGNLVCLDEVKLPKRAFSKCKCVKQNHWVSQGIRFSHFCGRNVELLWKNLGLRGGLIVKHVTKPFSADKALVRSLVPLWEEGLLLIRCSIFFAVISGVCLLVWYGKAKAKTFVEAKLLPSVCSVLSEYIQRELDFGKVRQISPLSITLESCSIGPHNEEFSCGEVPTVKLQVLPFASLRRGKIVIDAVLSNPSLLVVQKKNYTWLGIPSTDGSLQRHLSSEEGIDHCTKIRRIAREETAARFDKERDDAAKEAADMGYILSEKGSHTFEIDVPKDYASRLSGLATSESFFSMDERLHWRDDHCMDTGIEYDLKHADLEKAFGVKIPGSGDKFWSRFIPGPIRYKFKRKANGRDRSVTGVAAKRRIIERSASAARSYFLGLSHGRFGDSNQSSGDYDVLNTETPVVKSEVDTSARPSVSSYEEHITTAYQDGAVNFGGVKNPEHGKVEAANDYLTIGGKSRLEDKTKVGPKYEEKSGIQPFPDVHDGDLGADGITRHVNMPDESSRLEDQTLKSIDNVSDGQRGHRSQSSTLLNFEPLLAMHHSIPIWLSSLKLGLPSSHRNLGKLWSYYLAGPVQKLKLDMSPKVEDIIAELVNGADEMQTSGIEKMLPVTLDSVHFKDGTLMLLAYGDKEPREMHNVNGHVKFQNHYGRVHVQLSGNCSMWRSEVMSEDGGWLSTDVFVDIVEQKWHANLKVVNIFAPIFERILEIPILWSKGRASGEVHICMSRGETFPNLHGQLDVTGLAFQIYDAPSWFSDVSASLCFRGQRIFLHNASGWFGNVPLEASGDFGINPEEGEFHLMCQVPCVEVNALMKTFKMRPLLFPLAGSVTAVFNCQGPLDAPVFVGSGLVSRKIAHSLSDFPASSASEAMMNNKDAGAVAAVDRIPFSYISANFTFNSDNCVADLYGIRASLVDGGEIRGAGNAWVCPEGEVDETAMDMNFSGNLCFDNIVQRYLPGSFQLMPFKLGYLNGETKVSGSLLKPRFDIKWTAPKAEGSFSEARGDIIISHDYITVDSSSVAFELFAKVQTSYPDEYWINRKEYDAKGAIPIIVEGVELDLRMRSFEFFSLVSSYPFDSLRPIHLKATGRIKFQGNVVKPFDIIDEQFCCSEKKMEDMQIKDNGDTHSLVGQVSISGLKLNQLTLAPQLVGSLSISRKCIKLDATGRPDESLAVEVLGALQPNVGENLNGKVLSFSLQKGHLRANVCYRPLHSANLEVRHLPLDELELASLRGALQRVSCHIGLLDFIVERLPWYLPYEALVPMQKFSLIFRKEEAMEYYLYFGPNSAVCWVKL
ncbi:uncharacterized protein LOC114302829 isoform X3 [Camellia sinensis]|uniref:uncharacterized protein LOC114302829 isoform X3 n=1 Tax=Camellia sinensis TaxID=4442 RepID=UPI0010357342|nr:uncharacterized protein LOC114302829 isoform X3 [Camellia sinensis]